MRRSIISILLTSMVISLAAQPQAFLTKGLTEVCDGDSTQAYLSVTGGTGPWTVVISNSQGIYRTLADIPSSYTIWLAPTISTNYFISAVFDINDVEGTGNGNVNMTVHPRMPVGILLDQTAYTAADPQVSLVSDPPGANFLGQGVLGSTFYPSFVNPENSPFDISCVYYNEHGCPSYDTVSVDVIWGESDVVLVSGGDTINTVCRDDTNYEIIGSNRDSLPGIFSLREAGTGDPVTGHILDEDSADNVAMFDPAGLIGTFELVYAYTFDVLTITSTRILNVNDLENLTIEGLPDLACQSDNPYPLNPANVAGDPGAVYSFSGPGIGGNQANGYYFDPGAADVPLGTGTIVMEYASSNGCFASVNQTVQTRFAPKVSFTQSPACLAEGGETVSFNNTSSGKFAVEQWTWDFGDPGSGDQNQSNAENPTHFYTGPGARTISLTAETDQGCMVTEVREVVLSDQPTAALDWVHDCYVKGGKISFRNQSVSNVSEIDDLVWTFKNENGFVLGTVSSEDPDESIGFPFSSRGIYQVQLEVWDQEGCYDDVTEAIELKPTLALDLQGYTENFNGNADGWSAGSDSGAFSWVLGTPDFSGFGPSSAGDYAWYTDLQKDTEDSIEYSWVESPCFDFSGTQKPSLSLDLMKSFIPGKGGAVLQYMGGDDQGWQTIGNIGAGDNWYNVSGLEYQPGGSNSGWSTLPGSQADSTWQRARLIVDELNGLPLVKFRIALAASVGSDENDGFAFDDFVITEDLRGSVLEYFTNSSQEAALAADDQVDEFALANTAKVIDIQYHLDYPGVDPMNANNPSIPQNRQFQIGVPASPYAVLNGRAEEDYRFDFSGPGEYPDQALLDQASLESSPFSIDISADWQGQSMEAAVRVTCVAGSFESNVQLYVVVFETLVTAYTGQNGDTGFRNVVLDMLPSPAGDLLGNQWTAGQVANKTFTWDYPSYVEDVEDLAVVAFVADRDHGGKVLQAEATYMTPQVGTGPLHTATGDLAVFPNPASGLFYVRLNETSSSGGVLAVTDVSGKSIWKTKVPAGYRMISVDPDADAIPAGIYFITWQEKGRLMGRAKLIRSR